MYFVVHFKMCLNQSLGGPSPLCIQLQVIIMSKSNTTGVLFIILTLRLLMSHIYGAPSKARNANVVYIWTYVWQR